MNQQQASQKKEIIKDIKEYISSLKQFLAPSGNQQDDVDVTIFVAQRNARGHLRNLGSFKLSVDRLSDLLPEIRLNYGPGRYCISLAFDHFRSEGIDVLIGGDIHDLQAARLKPWSRMIRDERHRILAEMASKVTFKDFLKWSDNYKVSDDDNT